MAVVGAGRLGGFHAQKLHAMPEVDLVGVADPVTAQRNRVAEACQTQAFEDPRELLDLVDAVVIATPTRLHYEVGMEFLSRGIHVLMEKPITTTSAQADELVATARSKRAILQVGHVERFNPAFNAAVPHLRNPKYIEAVRTSPFSFRSTDVGAVLDMMIHDLDLVMTLTRSRVSKVEALGLSVLGGHEDVANVRLEFESGCVASLSACRVSYESTRRMQVWSPQAFGAIDFGALTISLIRPSETLLTRRFDVDSLTPEQVEHYKKHLADEHLPREQQTFQGVDALSLEAKDFVESILSPRQPRVTGQHGRDAVYVAEQILDAIDSHAWDDTVDGPVGPMAIPRPRVVPSPHFNRSPIDVPVRRREAG
jgi:predicted dehydrogenase